MVIWSELPEIVIVILISLGSGTGGYINDVRKEKKILSFLDYGADIFMAVNAGIGVFYMGQWREWEAPLIYLVVLIATNNGTELIELAKTKLKTFLLNYGKEK